jgi:hypothetical protein
MMLDFASQTDYLWALLPEIVLSLWAMLVLLVDVFQKGNRIEPSRPMIAWLVARRARRRGRREPLAPERRRGSPDGHGRGRFVPDLRQLHLPARGVSRVLISIGYLDRWDINRGEFYVLLMFATVGMMLLGSARDLILLFLALELMSVAIYVLVGFNRRDPRSSRPRSSTSCWARSPAGSCCTGSR